MQEAAAEKILKKLQSGYCLPPLSAVALSLLELASDENATNAQLVGLIEKDPSLIVRVLTLANSSFCSEGAPATTLSRAVLKLGSEQVRLMALSISLRGAFPFGKVEQFDYELFWRVSLYRGLIAKGLAQRSGAANPEEAFLCGLTMEIGMPILFDLLIKGQPEQFDLCFEPLEEVLEKERHCLGIDHRMTGAAALAHWRFAEQIIECQSAGEAEGAGQGRSALPALCRLARLFSRILLRAPVGFRPFYAEAYRLLGLDHEDVHEILLSTFSEVEEAAKSLRVEVDKDKDILTVMERANGALAQISSKIYRTRDSRKTLPTFDSLCQGEKTVTETLQAVAHEVRNPLTAVGGFARRLAASLDPGSQAGKYARVILEEAQRLEKALSGMTA
ncbi:MAG: HDOD domain-containing protein [Syntrophobacteraceae bacterium]|nr:HDOD domain-containing protein [Syntrophobacteraceae bacterium]